MTRWKQLWFEIKTSFWLIPVIINIALILIAILVIEVDYLLGASKHQLAFKVVSFQEESVRTFLATIAGSMMTIAGVVFSITILVLAQTARQYTSRVLRNFMRKKSNQVMLGIFVGIFIFCLFLITNVHPTDNALTALSGFILALTGVGFLIYYIHQTSLSIQATEILRNIQEETSGGITTLYPHPLEEKEIPQIKVEATCIFYSQQTGYLQAIDFHILLSLAAEYDTQIEVPHKIGDFIAQGEEICMVEKDIGSDGNFSSQVYRSLIIGKYRTAAQDVAYGIQQIVDLALRGLAPGNNDLSTTQVAIDYLKTVFIQLADKDLGSPIHYHNDRPMVIAPIHSFSYLLDAGFKAICANAKDQPTIQDKINEAIEAIKHLTQSAERKSTLDRYTCNL